MKAVRKKALRYSIGFFRRHVHETFARLSVVTDSGRQRTWQWYVAQKICLSAAQKICLSSWRQYVSSRNHLCSAQTSKLDSFLSELCEHAAWLTSKPELRNMYKCSIDLFNF